MFQRSRRMTSKRFMGRRINLGGRHRTIVPGITRRAGYWGRFGPRRGRYANGRGAVELKFHDLDIDDAVITAGGVIVEDSVVGIAQGVTESERIGRKCTVRQIGWKFNITLATVDAQATPAAADIIRVILYLDKQCNGAAAAVTDILESADYQSFNNLSNKSRFRTLMDRTYNMNYQTLASDNAGVVSSSNKNISDSYYKKCNIPIEFSATTGAITEIRSNNIGVLVVGSNGIGGFFSKMRIRFSDS